MERLTGAGRYQAPAAGEANGWVERFRTAALSVGTYSIPAGGLDDQSPHREDEVYVVTAGRGRITAGEETTPVAPGDVLFVPAGEAHQFHDVDEDLALLVLFAPAYSGE